MNHIRKHFIHKTHRTFTSFASHRHCFSGLSALPELPPGRAQDSCRSWAPSAIPALEHLQGWGCTVRLEGLCKPVPLGSKQTQLVACLLERGWCAQEFLSPTVNKELLKHSQGFEIVIKRWVIVTSCSPAALQMCVGKLLGWDVAVIANYHLWG